jgi:hypothetical protein
MVSRIFKDLSAGGYIDPGQRPLSSVVRKLADRLVCAVK